MSVKATSPICKHELSDQLYYVDLARLLGLDNVLSVVAVTQTGLPNLTISNPAVIAIDTQVPNEDGGLATIKANKGVQFQLSGGLAVGETELRGELTVEFTKTGGFTDAIDLPVTVFGHP